MEKRIIIASVLSVLLILGWGYLMPHQMHPKTASIGTSPINKINEKTVSKKAAALLLKKPGSPVKSVTVAKSVQSIKNISYKSSQFSARFNMLTGAISGLNLRGYSYTEKNPADKVNLANSKSVDQIFNFVPENAGPNVKLINIKKGKNSVEFIYSLNNKIILTKSYKFLNGSYILVNGVSIQNLTGKSISFKGHYIISAAIQLASKDIRHINLVPIAYVNKSSITPNVVQKTVYNGDISFAGFNSKYFLFSAIAVGDKISVNKIGKVVSFTIPKTITVPPKKTVNLSLRVYAGPKKLSLLTPLGHGLSSTLSFGFFGFFSVILLHILEFFYGFVHNYGIAIILLVLAIRIVFYPLTYTGFKSMKQMQKLTPKINDLREKYKDNKAELNKKIMELYKESRVNPFGGCLPMVLQIPVFYGLYQTLLTSIQLRNAPFILWIHSLSAQDPYYILPVLMGITMLISQKMNPVIGDPTQAKIMLILPIVFTFIFIHFPAGLLLYWTVNNILTIAQQYIINRKFA